jgi:PPOX class probable F420-dependent enzyme
VSGVVDPNRIFERLRHPAARAAGDAQPVRGGIHSLAASRYGLLITYRRSGKGVATPVSFAEVDGRLYVRSEGDTGKVKRIRAGSKAAIAPCTFRGRPTGPPISVHARFVAGDEASVAEAALAAKYGLSRRIYRRVFPPGEGSVYIELSSTEHGHHRPRHPLVGGPRDPRREG